MMGEHMKLEKNSGGGRNVMNAVIVAIAMWGHLPALAGEPAKGAADWKAAAQTDPYYKPLWGWELRPLETARKQGKLIFQSDFSEAGLARDWKADGVTVELKDGTAILSLSPERIAANKKYGVLWAKTPFAQPLMIELEFTLDPATPHDANVFWGQKEPSSENLGKDQECYIMGYFGWGGRGCGFECAGKGGCYGITGTVEPKLGVRYTGVWIIQGQRQCLYLDGTLLVYSQTPTPPPASGHLGLSVYQSRVLFHSVKVYNLPSK
jgi:hypothetical protein